MDAKYSGLQSVKNFDFPPLGIDFDDDDDDDDDRALVFDSRPMPNPCCLGLLLLLVGG